MSEVSLNFFGWNAGENLLTSAGLAVVSSHASGPNRFDVGVISESVHPDTMEESSELLLGEFPEYDIRIQRHDDGRPDERAIALLVRRDVEHTPIEAKRYAGRFVLRTILYGQVGFTGLHAPDESGPHRAEMFAEMDDPELEKNEAWKSLPVKVRGGDFNDDYVGGIGGVTLQALGALVRPLSHQIPTRETAETMSLPRILSMAERMGAMAAGEAIRAMTAKGWQDVALAVGPDGMRSNPQPTMTVGPLGLRLDRFMYLDLESRVTPSGPVVVGRHPGIRHSHSSVSAQVTIKL